MFLRKWMPWAAAVLSAVLLDLPFPIAGPMPSWRGLIAFIALVPLLWAVLRPTESLRQLRRAFLIAYLCGVLWYAGNCYWIYDTMQIHGGIPPVGSVGILLLYSLVLGLYFALFGLAVRFVAGRLCLRAALLAAPFFWAGLDLVAARVTSVPWDQLGYSQVDNVVYSQLAPVTGVYGITFLLVIANALLAGGLLLTNVRQRVGAAVFGAVLFCVGCLGLAIEPAKTQATANAVLMQPNLSVDALNSWPGPQWDQHIAEFTRFATRPCAEYQAGIPETGAADANLCAQPDLVAWPESPAPYFEDEDRFRNAMQQVALAAHAPLVIGGVGMEPAEDGWREFNSGMVFDRAGKHIGRYDKIHLVPFGEFIPYRDLFFFAKKLTRKVDDLSRGTERKVFVVEDSHGQMRRYGVFICYESVFADEVRQFAKNGAEVFVNISDDGWYGDTSAPWQHLNMARLRAIENRRWILRDTNNGVTAAIDPDGRVRQSIPRHAVNALIAQYGFNSDVTFYTAHGDVFAWLCAILSAGLVAWLMNRRGRASSSL